MLIYSLEVVMLPALGFSDEQSARILQEADRSSIAEVAKRHGLTEPSTHSWRKKLTGIAPH